MLYLVRKLNESIIVNDDIEVKVVEIKNNYVKIGIAFPSSAKVYRKELHERIKRESLNTSGPDAACVYARGAEEEMD